MSAFLDLLNVYAIWIYIVGIVGILFGIRTLVDSRRQARTTLFTLEQEQAHDRAFRAILIMAAFAAVMFSVMGVNSIFAPVRPTPEAVVARDTVAVYTPPIVLPTITAVPTLTAADPTATMTLTPTRAAPTAIPATPVAQATAIAAPVKPPAPTSPPPASISYPQPAPWNPAGGSTVTSGFVHFRWDNGTLPANLPPGQMYLIKVSYTDRDSNQPIAREMCWSSSNFQARANTWPELANAQGRALNDLFTWSVIVVQVTNANGWCGDGSPLSPPSPTMTFKWAGG